MKFVYIAAIRLPTEKAHGMQIMKTCEALAGEEIAVELIIPTRQNPIQEDPFSYYGVKKNFTITRLRCPDFVSGNLFGALGFWLQSWLFYRAVKKYLRDNNADAYYTRDLPLALWLPNTRKPLYYEIHTLPDRVSRRHARAWKRCAGLVVISDGLKQALLARGVPEKKICVARDAVDLERFVVKESMEESRRRFGIPVDQKMVVYTGHLYEWKGANALAEAAALLPEGINVYLVGGRGADVRAFKRTYASRNLHIVGWRPQEEIPYWLNAADVLVLPNSARTAIGSRYTSPLKAFEYLVAGRPIVASDVPALHEIFDATGRALFVAPDDSDALAKGIHSALSQPFERGTFDLGAYGWDARARRIRDFIPRSHG